MNNHREVVNGWQALCCCLANQSCQSDNSCLRKPSAASSSRQSHHSGVSDPSTHFIFVQRCWTGEERTGGSAHPIQHVGPTLHGDALKHCQHGKQEVVEVGNATVGSLPAFSALAAIDEALAPMPWDCTWSWFLLCYWICIEVIVQEDGSNKHAD